VLRTLDLVISKLQQIKPTINVLFNALLPRYIVHAVFVPV